MARKLGQIIARGQSTWLVRLYQRRDPEIGMREYHNQGSREAQLFPIPNQQRGRRFDPTQEQATLRANRSNEVISHSKCCR